MSYRGHEEREMGFRHTLGEDFAQLRVAELREVRALLVALPQLHGIYNIGTGNPGIARALEEIGRACKVVCVGHELSGHTRHFLLSGTIDTVIDQSPYVEAREAIEHLLLASRASQRPEAVPIRIHVIFREIIPEHL
jgi:LacI family transcriptional regulator